MKLKYLRLLIKLGCKGKAHMRAQARLFENAHIMGIGV